MKRCHLRGPIFREGDCWSSAWLLETAGSGRRAASSPPHVSLYPSVSLTALCFTVSPAVQDSGVLGTREVETGLVLPGDPNLGEDVHGAWHWGGEQGTYFLVQGALPPGSPLPVGGEWRKR